MDRKTVRSLASVSAEERKNVKPQRRDAMRRDETQRDAPNDLIAWAMNVLARVVRVTPTKDLSTFESSFFALATPSVLERARYTQWSEQRRKDRRSESTRHETRSSRFAVDFLVVRCNAPCTCVACSNVPTQRRNRWMNRTDRGDLLVLSASSDIQSENESRFERLSKLKRWLYVPHQLSRPGTLRMRRIWKDNFFQLFYGSGNYHFVSSLALL